MAAMVTTGDVDRPPRIETSWPPEGSRSTEAAAVATAEPAPIRPDAPTATASPKTRRWLCRVAGMSLLACKALQLPAAVGIELGHLPGEVAECRVPVARDERVDARLRAQIGVLVARVDRAVQVGLALATARDEALFVQTTEDRHVGRVRARLLRALVERLHDLAHRHLVVAAPDIL